MSKHIFLLLMVTTIFACKPSGEKVETTEAHEVTETVSGDSYAIDPNGSDVKWEGTQLGKKHHGTIAIKEGSIQLENGVIKAGKVILDMNSITDLDMEGEYKQKLETHLKSADFFDAATHPEAVFEISKTVKNLSDETYNILVYGNLTIKGITKGIQFKAQLDGAEDGISVIAPAFTFDRSEFDVRYGSDKFFDNLGDKAIHNEIGLTLSIKAFK